MIGRSRSECHDNGKDREARCKQEFVLEHHGIFLPIDTPLSFRHHVFVIYLSKGEPQWVSRGSCFLLPSTASKVGPVAYGTHCLCKGVGSIYY